MKSLSVLLIIMQCIGFASPVAQALGNLDFSSSMMTGLINDSTLPVAPGVQERRITLLNSIGKRVENFIIEVDLKNSPNTSIVTGSYKDGTEYGMSTVREQASYAIANGKQVVAGVNADFYNMATGEPLGCFVKNGSEIKALPSNWSFFGIKKDGTPVIGDYDEYQANREELQEALGGQRKLVDNGNVIEALAANPEIHPRSAVGIKENGAVIFIISDGRQEPYSAGYTYTELAQLMKDLGCVEALNLDGGGSATFVAREQGTDGLVYKNRPSDGIERVVANSFLVVSDTPANHQFASAVIEPFDRTYTPNSTISFSAKGMDSSGASAVLPESGLSWRLSDDSFGTLNSETGEFISNGKEGQVEVQLVYEEAGAGSANMMTEGDAGEETNDKDGVNAEVPEGTDEADGANAEVPEGTDEADGANAEVPEGTDEADGANAESPEGTDEADGVNIESPEGTDEADGVNSESPEGTDEADGANAESPEGTDEADGVNSEVPEGTDEADGVKEESPEGTNEADIDDTGTPEETGDGHTEDIFIPQDGDTSAQNMDISNSGLAAGGEVVGSTFVEIAVPDDIYFVQTELSLEFDISSDLGFMARYKGRDVVLKDGDIVWNIPDGMGVMDSNNIFHTSLDGSVSGIITASLAATGITAQLDVKVGQLPVILYDFEDGVSDWKPGSAGRGEKVSIEAVDYASGEPVRFGDKSLKINFDLTTAQTGTTLGAYAGPGTSKDIPGAPTAIGAWIYATEEARGYWLRMYLYDAGGQYKPIDFTANVPGIDWTGWKYVQANIPSTYQGPFKTYPNQMIRMMSTKSGTVGPMTKGEVYIDNVRMVYGASVDDMFNPIINDINVDGKTYTTSAVNISTTFTEDLSDKYATGMNYDRINMYVDGKDYTHAEGIYALNKGLNTVSISGFSLPDGLHRADVVVQDNFGNETKKTAYFTINTGTGTTVSMDSPNTEGAPLGGIYKINIKTNNPADIKEVIAKIKIGKDFPVQSVDFGPGDSGSTSQYDNKKGILTLNISNSSVNTSEEILATANISVPAATLPSQKLNYSLEYSDIKYNSDKGSYGASFGAMPESVDITADYTVEIKDALVGREGRVLVKDRSGNPVEGAAVKVRTGGTVLDLGVTGPDGIAAGTAMTDAVKGIEVYAEKDGLISFTVSTQSFKPFKDNIPSNILAVAVENSSTSKNITWMSNPLTSQNAAIMQIALKSDYEAQGEAAFANVTGKFNEASFAGESDINSNGIVRLNSAVAKGLTAGAVYSFRVGDGVSWSDVREFSTAQDGADTNFFVLGDTQTSDTANLLSVLDALENTGINYDFSMHVGDIIDDASRFNQLDAVSGALESYAGSSDADLIAVLGNHEYMGDEDGFIARTYYNTPLNGPAENLGACYSTEYGNVYAAVISFTTDRDLLEAQLEWLRADIAKTDKKWKMLVTHQPVYYSNPEGGNGLFKEVLPAVMDELGIDLVFSGHDHSYGRTLQLKGGKESRPGTTYIIAGSTGIKYYKGVNDGTFAVFANEEKPIYITGSAGKDSITIKALRPDGTEVDSFTIEKGITVEAGHATASSGGSVEVGVKLTDLEDFGGARIKLGYDSSKLTYKKIEFSEEMEVSAVNADIPGEIYFAVLSSEGITKQQLEAARITFDVNSDIDTQMELPISILSAEACNTDKEDLAVFRQDGSVLVIPGEASIPEALDVSFTGEAVVGQTLTAKYTYRDAKSVPEEGTSFRWLISETGKNSFEPIENETGNTLLVKPEYAGKDIRVEVTVRNAKASGQPVQGDNSRNTVIVRGDVLMDGKVDYKDALHILQSTVEKVVLNRQQTAAADINSDGQVNVQDVIYMLKAVLSVSQD
ncbi:phosphodiester glycosidase family protein [Anaerobacterium chartisolvens]|uniref:phosphodiester glycosidase family protein n=1 Tax=Anaerobacterium chartisolvens TaxID=1297424 RepID=UPI001A9A4E80|nr:phosphodiester glycosidase family protein [Anaerobacterium chartisolvens]